jgi:hypothetical protein
MPVIEVMSRGRDNYHSKKFNAILFWAPEKYCEGFRVQFHSSQELLFAF